MYGESLIKVHFEIFTFIQNSFSWRFHIVVFACYSFFFFLGGRQGNWKGEDTMYLFIITFPILNENAYQLFE